MGKRSKLFKTGKNKAYNTVMKARRKTKLAVVLPHLKEKHSLEIKIQPKKLIDDKPIKLRHRRVKDRSILSKGQQRRKLKKLKHEIRKNIPNKVLKQEKSDEIDCAYIIHKNEGRLFLLGRNGYYNKLIEDIFPKLCNSLL